VATATASRPDLRRTEFGTPATKRRGGLAVFGWIVVLLAAGLTMGWRAMRWADRNL
jgi:hypothetical protein